MKLTTLIALIPLFSSLATTTPTGAHAPALNPRVAEPDSVTPWTPGPLRRRNDDLHILLPRKGGGGSSSGGRGGGGGTTTTGRGGSSGGSGGLSRGGSGAPPRYGSGGNKFYTGGARQPYSAGLRSPGGIVPFVLPLALASSLLGGLWLYSAWAYQWPNPVVWSPPNLPNVTQVIPGLCLCQEYSVCGCDANDDINYVNSVLADVRNNLTDVAVVKDVNGTLTLVVNGTLPNGTTADGGTDYSDGATVLVTGKAAWVAWVAVVGGMMAAAL